jgi:hypothetical protein
MIYDQPEWRTVFHGVLYSMERKMLRICTCHTTNRIGVGSKADYERAMVIIVQARSYLDDTA